jgi:hypothetical protein
MLLSIRQIRHCSGAISGLGARCQRSFRRTTTAAAVVNNGLFAPNCDAEATDLATAFA